MGKSCDQQAKQKGVGLDKQAEKEVAKDFSWQEVEGYVPDSKWIEPLGQKRRQD